jgi:UPF0716 protein FxsA
MLLIFLLLCVGALVELYVIVQVAQQIGVFETLALLIVVSLVGAWLVKREGLGVIRRIQTQTANGRVPTDELVDGGIIIGAGALMFAPGFVSDIVGLLLLVPPVRALVRRGLIRRFKRRIPGVATGRFWRRTVIVDGRVVDVDSSDDTRRDPPPRGELEP